MPSTVLFTPIRLLYQAVPGPHALTVRATYTVPAGKRSVLQSAFCTTEDAAGIYGLDVVGVRINTQYLIFTYTVGALDVRYVAIAPMLDLVSGDTVDIVTVNGTAGTRIFAASVMIREYQ